MRDDGSSSERSGTGGIDLHLDRRAGVGSGELAASLRTAIRENRLTAGSRVPSTRLLATDLGVSRGTVTRAYELLVAEGLLVTRQGAATTVAAVDSPVPERRRESATRRATELRWDLRPGKPDLSGFPRADWLAAQRRALRAVPAEELDYGHPAGHPALRGALAEYLARVRGVRTSPERIVVFGGYGEALGMLCEVLARRGVSAVDFEDPSLPELRRIAGESGPRVRGVPLDGSGIEPAGAHSPVVVVTPAHQYPLGITMSAERRIELGRLARAEDRLIVEDDYDGEFRFDREPVAALQRIAPRQVVYAGTASKTLAPGLRLAWLALPERLVEPVREHKANGDRTPPVTEQLTLAEMLRSGSYDQHVRRCRAGYERRRQRVVAALTESKVRHELYPAGIAAGLHLTLRLAPEGPSERRVLRRLRRHSVAVKGLSEHWMDDRLRQEGLVIGYAAPPGHAFGQALRALLRALTED
ncbi:PLP-dependent aminotransferase family protein [Actinopolyspora erythraea]|uniref:GntR family transcriptional regulator n=1 Tax=Actinopolyspora erythraea TaxID=414996 RepID=A0A099DAT0_9ACTN|nr:PLP-dependent aminotransferase family protein [Actinopolyspora erythraea]ASU80176.1 PLP-dependent aminotransferase family protein [Actinopolyspora erythraea]KGI82455.1 GntR family transcriptional regulator [Actinopolyspora erythraea]